MRSPKGCEVRVVRFHNVYGPLGAYDWGETSPAALCRKVAEAEAAGEVIVWGNGRYTRSYTSLVDCGEGIHRLMRSHVPGPPYVRTDRLVTVDEFADAIAEAADKENTREYDFTASIAACVRKSIGDVR